MKNRFLKRTKRTKPYFTDVFNLFFELKYLSFNSYRSDH